MKRFFQMLLTTIALLMLLYLLGVLGNHLQQKRVDRYEQKYGHPPLLEIDPS